MYSNYVLEYSKKWCNIHLMANLAWSWSWIDWMSYQFLSQETFWWKIVLVPLQLITSATNISTIVEWWSEPTHSAMNIRQPRMHLYLHLAIWKGKLLRQCAKVMLLVNFVVLPQFLSFHIAGIGKAMHHAHIDIIGWF